MIMYVFTKFRTVYFRVKYDYNGQLQTKNNTGL